MACAVGAAIMALVAGGARAQEPGADYKGAVVSIVVGYGPGGGYDQAARVLAKHYPRFLPGEPRVIVRNMPGAGTVTAANYVFNTAPRDGTVLGIYADISPLAPLLGVTGVQFDPRAFGWIGSMASRGTPVVIMRADAPAKNFEELRTHETLVGASGPDATSSYALLLNELLGTRMKIIQGYRGGTAEIELAIQRGEVHGRASAEWERIKSAEWVRRDAIRVLLQMSLKRHPELKDVPTALEHARNEDDRSVMELIFGSSQFFRAFSTPPGVPASRLETLRRSFAAAMKDEELVKDYLLVQPGGIDFSTHQEIESFLARAYALRPEIIQRASKFIGQ
ncbi:MAG: Bug family tripartite tricarboxylate transporter substrate binding protein [Beijerinckiaceae bacterium]